MSSLSIYECCLLLTTLVPTSPSKTLRLTHLIAPGLRDPLPHPSSRAFYRTHIPHSLSSARSTGPTAGTVNHRNDFPFCSPTLEGVGGGGGPLGTLYLRGATSDPLAGTLSDPCPVKVSVCGPLTLKTLVNTLLISPSRCPRSSACFREFKGWDFYEGLFRRLTRKFHYTRRNMNVCFLRVPLLQR